MKKKIVKKILIILLIIISIALVLSLIHIMKNYIIVKKVEKNISTYLDSTNYHIKINQTDDKNKDLKIVVNYYKKDDKEVVVLERYKNDELSKMSMYNNGEGVDIFWDTKDVKTAKLNTESSLTVSIYNCLETDNIWQTLFACTFARIKNIDYNNKNCYMVANYKSPTFLTGSDKNEVYLDKDTGLCMKMVIDSETYEREYEFDNVSDDIFVEPDINQYTLQ